MDKQTAEWIETFYSDIEKGMRHTNHEYTRPADYVERALRVLNAPPIKKRRVSIRGEQQNGDN